MLDTLQTFETPEGVELGLKLAGPAPRALAWLIDGLIKLVLLSLSGVFFSLGEFGDGLSLVIAFAVLWLYNVLFEVYSNGATPGKKSLGLQVMNVNGTPVDWAGSVIRNLVRVVDALPVLYGLGVITCLGSRRFQRIGDLAAGTVVVYQASPQAPAIATTERSEPLRQPLSPEEQRWILAYSERASHLTKERAIELAEILEDVTGQSGTAAVDTLHAYGNWLAGRS